MNANEGLFHGGPPTRLYVWLRLRSTHHSRVQRLAIAAALVSWLPLALLAAAHGDVISSMGPGSFLRDFAVHARYLVAVPLLIAAQPACASVLGALARHFGDSGLVVESDAGRFEAAMASTRRLRDATAAEVLVIAITYVIVAAVVYSVSPDHLPAWHIGDRGGAFNFSAAGWWHILVSMPLLMILVLGWLWRLFLWGRFLWLVSRLNLKLLPAHPDRAAGLRFVGYSINALAPFATALGVIAAGMVADRVINEGAALLAYKFLVAGLAAFLVALIVAPLLAFTDKLLSAWQRGVLDYGALANRIAGELERNWIGRTDAFLANPLHGQTASAATSLCTLSSNVYAMRFIPLDPRSIIVLVAMTLLPFIPVILMVLPLNVVIKDLSKFLI
jgi:hypothetical protein